TPGARKFHRNAPCAPRPSRHLLKDSDLHFDSHRAVVGAHDITTYPSPVHTPHEVFIAAAVVDAPAHIARARTASERPPGVMIRFTWVVVPEGVDKPGIQEVVHRIALFLIIARAILVALWPGEVQGLVSNVKVTAQNDVLTLLN